MKGFLALVPGWGAWSILGGMAVAVPVYGILLLVLKTMPEEELYRSPSWEGEWWRWGRN